MYFSLLLQIFVTLVNAFSDFVFPRIC